MRGGAEGLAQDRSRLSVRRPVCHERSSCSTARWPSLAGAHGCGRRSSRAAAGKPCRSAGGNGTLYVGGYPGKISIIDEATEKVIGEIPSRPASRVDMTLSRRPQAVLRRRRAPARRSRSSTSRRSASRSTRSRSARATGRSASGSCEPDPLDTLRDPGRRSTATQAGRSLGDRAADAACSTTSRRTRSSRTIPWPKGEERERASIMFSPDGKLLYLFGDDVLIYDTTNFTQVDKWELSRRSRRASAGSTSAASTSLNEEPGFYTGLLHVAGPGPEPPHHGHRPREPRREEGRLLSGRPGRAVSASRWRPDRKRGVRPVQRTSADYEFWTFDLETARLPTARSSPGRPRMALQDSTQRQAALHLPGRQHDRPLRRARRYKLPADDHARRRHDDDLFVFPPGRPRRVVAQSTEAVDPRLPRAAFRLRPARTGGGWRSCSRSASSAPALSLCLPYLTQGSRRRRAARPRSRRRSCASSCCSSASTLVGLRPERRQRASATRACRRTILFDMRLDAVPAPAAAVAAVLRAHAARRHRLAHQQRHRRNPARRRRNGAGLGRQRAVPGRHGRHAALARLAAVSRRRWRRCR